MREREKERDTIPTLLFIILVSSYALLLTRCVIAVDLVTHVI